MEIHKANDGYKTIKQWKKENRIPFENAPAKEMWNNAFFKSIDKYYLMKDTREMNSAEIESYKNEQKEKNRAYRDKCRKEKINIQFINLYEDYLREIYHTPFQWLELGFKVKENAEYKSGDLLNWSKESSSPFSKDYDYVKFEHVQKFEDLETYVTERIASHKAYYKEDPAAELIESWKRTNLQIFQDNYNYILHFANAEKSVTEYKESFHVFNRLVTNKNKKKFLNCGKTAIYRLISANLN